MNRQEQLIEAFNGLRTSIKNNNTLKLQENIAEDYRGFSLNGTIETKSDILNSFRPGGVQLTEYRTEHMEFEVCGDLGIVTGKGFVSGNFQGFTFTHNVLFTDIFKFTFDGWKYYRSQATEIKS